MLTRTLSLWLLLLPACVSVRVPLTSSMARKEPVALRTHTVGPVPTGRAPGWALRHSLERSRFDLKQQILVPIQAPGPYYFVGSYAPERHKMERLENAISYSEGRFVFEGVFGASDVDSRRWQGDRPNLSIGTRIAGRLAEFGPFAVGASVRLTNNRSLLGGENKWLEGEGRAAIAVLPQLRSNWPVLPYGGAGYRRIDGSLEDRFQYVTNIEAELTYGFAGIVIDCSTPSAALQLSVESMFGDLKGVQFWLTVVF